VVRTYSFPFNVGQVFYLSLNALRNQPSIYRQVGILACANDRLGNLSYFFSLFDAVEKGGCRKGVFSRGFSHVGDFFQRIPRGFSREFSAFEKPISAEGLISRGKRPFSGDLLPIRSFGGDWSVAGGQSLSPSPLHASLSWIW
jgi:hypothetical protein